MIYGNLPHKSECRCLGKAIGTEIWSWVHRLLGDIVKNYTTRILGSHHTYGAFGDRLVSKEIKLEALPEHVVGNFSDPTLPCRTGIRNYNIDTAIVRTNTIEGIGDSRSISDITGER